MQKNKTFRPWIVMLAIGIISAACLGSSMVLMGSFLSPMSSVMHTSVAMISYYFTIIVLMMAVMMPVVPKVLSKVNNTLIYLIISIVTTCCLLVAARIDQIWMLFLLAVVIGIGNSFLSFVPVGILIDNWFNEKVGLATGICWAITSVYQGFMSPVLSNWISSMGYRKSLTILAVIVGILSIPCSFLIKFTPQQAHTIPYGFKKQKVHEEKTVNIPTKQILMSASFWIMVVITCLLQFPSVLNQMFPTYAVSNGFKGAVGGFMVTSAMLFDIFLNPLVGMSADKFGAEKASIAWLLVAFVSDILLIVATNIHSAVLAIFSAGINDVMYVFLGTGLTILAQSIFGSKAFARGFSLVSSVSFVVGAFAMPVNNLIAEKVGGFNMVFMFFAVLTLLAIFLIFISTKNHFEKKAASTAE